MSAADGHLRARSARWRRGGAAGVAETRAGHGGRRGGVHRPARSGALASFEATRFAAGRKNALRIELNGARGSLAFDLERLNELEFYDGDGADGRATAGFRRILVTEPGHPYLSAWWPPGHVLGWEHTFTHQARDLLTAIAARAPTRSPRSRTGCRSSACWTPSRPARRARQPVDAGLRPGDSSPDRRNENHPGADRCPDRSRCSPGSGPTCRWRRSARLASAWGYDGLELACWGDHFEVDRALREDGYLAGRHALLDKYGLRCWAISNHLVGQAVCDHPIDERHQAILPARIWGDGDARGGAAAGRGRAGRHRAGRGRVRRADRGRVHRLLDLAHGGDVPAGTAGDDRGGVRGLRPALEPDPGRVRRRGRAVRARGASRARSPTTSGPPGGRWTRWATGPRSG